MFLSYRYRLYPLRPHLPQLDRWRGELTFLWNYALEQRRAAWEREHRHISYLDQQSDLTRWRSFDTEGIGRVPTGVAQGILQRLDLAFRDFFRRVRRGETPGFPRFRRTTDSFSFVPPSDPWRTGPNETWRLHVPLLGDLPVRRHRPPPPGGSVRFVTIRREADGWFAVLAYAVPNPPAPPPPSEPPRHPVGIDLGLFHLATLSDGTVVEPPRVLRAAEQRLAREQRVLARRHRGSNRWRKQRERLARTHLKVARRRQWLAHQLSHDWTVQFDLVAMEELRVAELGRGRLAKSVHDAGWSTLRAMLEYKSVLRSHRFVAVDPRGTSQECSKCGERSARPMDLKVREFECVRGHRADRDVNAARNVLRRGLEFPSAIPVTLQVGRRPTEDTRGEIEPLPGRVGHRTYSPRHARSVNREEAPGRTGSAGGTIESPGKESPGPDE